MLQRFWKKFSPIKAEGRKALNFLMNKNLRSPGFPYTIVCRPALPKDTPEVMDFTARIWSGEDYVPQVWQMWMEDPNGQLAVAEYGSRVVGLGKVTRLSPVDWWLQGLRVHPDFQGHGVASHLHNYQLAWWEHNGSGSLRLTTYYKNEKVQRMCERRGFHKLGEQSAFSAPVLKEQDESFVPVSLDAVQEAFSKVMNSPMLPLTFGLMDLMWEWSSPQLQYVCEAIEQGRAWWWRGRRGLLLHQEDEDDGVRVPFIQFVACQPEELGDCLLDYRRLAARLEFEKASWIAPMLPENQAALEKAGFERYWEGWLSYIYEKRKDE
jgi:GNAT superfamily N-acetyltransferase